MHPFNAEKLSALMKAQRIDLVLVCSRHNMRYLTGYFYHFYENFTRIGVSQYMPLLGLPAKGYAQDSFYVGVAGERGQMDAERIVGPEPNQLRPRRSQCGSTSRKNDQTARVREWSDRHSRSHSCQRRRT